MGLRKRGKIWYFRIKLNGEEFPAISLCTSKKGEAESIDSAIRLALKDKNPGLLNETERGVIGRVLGNRVNEFLPGFNKIHGHPAMEDDTELTLFQASELVYKDPEVRGKSDLYRQRYKSYMVHLQYHLGPETPIESIKVRHLRRYRELRLDEGAAKSTINKEVALLSKMFRILKIEELVTDNPCSLLPALSEKDLQRQVYLSQKTFQIILENLPDWYRPIAELAYYCGMRQGEIWQLTRSQIDLKNRMIRLGPADTKEGDHKSVPLPRHLAQKLAEIMGGALVGIDLVFLKDGVPIRRHDLKRPWERAVKAAECPNLTFHDLRHTWRRNARKSGMDPDLRKSIMGHWWRGKGVDESYDLFDDEDRVEAIDRMTYDHGDTRLLTPPKAKKPKKSERTNVRDDKSGTPAGTEGSSQVVAKRRSAASSR